MNLLKKIALSTLLLASQSAFAQVYNLGSITPSSAVSFETESSSANFEFLDHFTFSLTTGADTLFGGAPDVRVRANGDTFRVNITQVFLYSGELGYGTRVTPDIDRSAEGFSFKNLTAGNYYFTVAGVQRADSLAGNYSFNLAATKITSAVAEPETFALLMGGLGLMGFIARRKSA